MLRLSRSAILIDSSKDSCRRRKGEEHVAGRLERRTKMERVEVTTSLDSTLQKVYPGDGEGRRTTKQAQQRPKTKEQSAEEIRSPKWRHLFRQGPMETGQFQMAEITGLAFPVLPSLPPIHTVDPGNGEWLMTSLYPMECMLGFSGPLSRVWPSFTCIQTSCRSLRRATPNHRPRLSLATPLGTVGYCKYIDPFVDRVHELLTGNSTPRVRIRKVNKPRARKVGFTWMQPEISIASGSVLQQTRRGGHRGRGAQPFPPRHSDRHSLKPDI